MNQCQLWMHLLYELKETRQEIRNFDSVLRRLHTAGISLTDNEVDRWMTQVEELARAIDRAAVTLGDKA